VGFSISNFAVVLENFLIFQISFDFWRRRYSDNFHICKSLRQAVIFLCHSAATAFSRSYTEMAGPFRGLYTNLIFFTIFRTHA